LENVELSLNIDKCINLANNLCDLFDTDVPTADLESVTMETLRYLWNQANLLYDLVQERPKEEGRSSRDYFDGVKLGELASKIALRLRSRELLSIEDIALRIQLKALLQVQGHYHHIIGPAMLAHCEVLEKLGQNQEAQENYDCIISDFSWFLDEYDNSNEIDYDEDIISIKSLHKALELRLKGKLSLKEKDIIEEKKKKTKALLSLGINVNILNDE